MNTQETISIANFWDIISLPGEVREIRAPKTKKNVPSGYFDNSESFSKGAIAWDGKVTGVYVTINPVNLALMARSSNKIKPYADFATADPDIIKRKFILIDVDPKRPAGISATDAERALALELTDRVESFLLVSGIPAGAVIKISTGNGGAIWLRVDLPNDDTTRELAKHFLEALDFLFSDSKTHIDIGVWNAARIAKIPGTKACKGESTADRPHRRSSIISAPEPFAVASIEIIRSIVARLPKPIVKTPSLKQQINAAEWLNKYSISILNTKDWQGAKLYEIVCPWNPEHDKGECRVVQYQNGAISAGCFHSSCQGKAWADLRKQFEPVTESKKREGPAWDKILEEQTDKTDKQGKTLTKLTNEQKSDIPDKQGKGLTTLTPLTKTDPSDKPSRGKIIWHRVDTWLDDHKGERFDLDLICRQIDIKNREDRHHVIKKLSYEVDQKHLEKSDKTYRNIYNVLENIDWVHASDAPPWNIRWPYGIRDGTKFGFNNHVVISPGDIIVVAGVSNMGKTCFCLNLLWDNMDIFPCTLMGNEYEAGKFKRRVSHMKWANPLNEDGTPKFELIRRFDNWADIIRPNNINIIDWINLGDSFYQIGKVIEGIRSKLCDGIAVVVLQKTEGKSLGLGGSFSEHLASFYLSIDFNRLTVVKAKEWYEFNPNKKMYGFEIEDSGTKFVNIREVKMCKRCSGTGRTTKGECQECEGKGYMEIPKERRKPSATDS